MRMVLGSRRMRWMTSRRAAGPRHRAFLRACGPFRKRSSRAGPTVRPGRTPCSRAQSRGKCVPHGRPRRRTPAMFGSLRSSFRLACSFAYCDCAGKERRADTNASRFTSASSRSSARSGPVAQHGRARPSGRPDPAGKRLRMAKPIPAGPRLRDNPYAAAAARSAQDDQNAITNQPFGVPGESVRIHWTNSLAVSRSLNIGMI